MGLLDLKPHVVSKDLTGYSVLLYGQPKSGKTTIATRFPGALLLAFERGYAALSGVFAQDINSWGEFKKILNELKNPEVQKVYKNVIIDTADLAYNFCEKYICNRENVENVSDLAYGKGYAMIGAEFDEAIRRIISYGYGCILISHATDKVFKNENGEEYNQIVPTLDKRGRLICERTCDIIGYSTAVDTPDGVVSKLYLRGTPRFVAGSRFKYIPPVIDFNYESLVNAIATAIDKEAEMGGAVSEARTQSVIVEPTYNFEELQAAFSDIVGKLMTNPSNSIKITQIVEKNLGKGKKFSDCTPAQCEQMDYIIDELKSMLNN